MKKFLLWFYLFYFWKSALFDIFIYLLLYFFHIEVRKLYIVTYIRGLFDISGPLWYLKLLSTILIINTFIKPFTNLLRRSGAANFFISTKDAEVFQTHACESGQWWRKCLVCIFLPYLPPYNIDNISLT